MKNLSLLLFVLCFSLSFGQANNNQTPTATSSNYDAESVIGSSNGVPALVSQDDNTIYTKDAVEVQPEFPGGIAKFYKFLAENFIIPNVSGLKGKVNVAFVVEKDGSLTDIKIMKDIGYGTGREAIRVVKLSPKWLPAELNGKKVRCSFDLPIAITSSE